MYALSEAVNAVKFPRLKKLIRLNFHVTIKLQTTKYFLDIY